MDARPSSALPRDSASPLSSNSTINAPFTTRSESAQANRLRGANGSSASYDSDEQLYSRSSKRATASRNTRFHKVRKGETLSSIARKRNTSVAAICKLNGIGKNIKLRPGQVLKYN